MSSLTGYGPLSIVTPTPTGAGGAALNTNFTTIADFMQLLSFTIDMGGGDGTGVYTLTNTAANTWSYSGAYDGGGTIATSITESGAYWVLSFAYTNGSTETDIYRAATATYSSPPLDVANWSTVQSQTGNDFEDITNSWQGPPGSAGATGTSGYSGVSGKSGTSGQRPCCNTYTATVSGVTVLTSANGSFSFTASSSLAWAESTYAGGTITLSGSTWTISIVDGSDNTTTWTASATAAGCPPPTGWTRSGGNGSGSLTLATCYDGAAGSAGSQGTSGVSGYSGFSGVSGTSGISGASGTFGANGTLEDIVFFIDGQGATPSTGSKAFKQISFSCTINAWTLTSDVAASCVIDVKRSTYSGFPTTSSIAGSDLPTLSSVQKNTNAGPLSSWGSTAITAGDILEFVVNSCSTGTKFFLNLKCTKT